MATRAVIKRVFLSLPVGVQSYLTQKYYQVVLQKSIPVQIRQPFLYISNNKGQIGGFVGELTLAKRFHKHSL